MSRFTLDLTAFVKKCQGNADLLVRKVAFEIFSRVVLKTPVDTGAARGNWQCAIGVIPAGADKNTTDKNGAKSISQIAGVVALASAGKSIYLANNLPYIERLENGYSKQAPVGMVATTIREFPGVVENISSELK